MGDKPLRIRLDLTEINLLPFKFKYVWVPLFSRDLKTIEDFKSTLYQKFDFDQNKKIKLFVQDSLLLDRETVMLLREDDTIKVVYDNQDSIEDYIENESLSSIDAKKKKRKKRHREECDLDLISPNSQKDLKLLRLSRSEVSELSVGNSNATTNPDKSEDVCPNISQLSHDKHVKKKRNKAQNWPSLTISELTQQIEVCSEHSTSSVAVLEETANSKNNSTSLNEAHQKNKRKQINSSETINDSASLLSNGKVTSDFSFYATDSMKILKSPKGVKRLETNSSISIASTSFSKPQSTWENDSSDMQHQNSQEAQKDPDTVEVLQSDKCCKKKRKRKRKKPIIIKPDEISTVNVEVESEDKLSKISSYQSETIPNGNHTVRKHIVFAEQTTDISAMTNNKSNVQVIDIESYLKKIRSTSSQKNKSQSTMSSTIDYATPIMSTPKNPIEDNSNVWDVTPVLDNSKQTNSWMDSENENSSSVYNKDNTVNYSTLPSLNTLPEIGSQIAFKVLELSDMYCPEVSDYKAGIVKSVNYQADEMEIELAKEEIKSGSTSIDVLNSVVLELAVNINGNFPVVGFKTFYRGLKVSGPMTAVFVNGYNINSLAHNTLKLSSNEMVTGLQYFSKPVLLQSSLLASWINNISTDSLREKFLTQFRNVNATLDYFKYVSRYLDSSLSQQLEASAYQISSFAFFTLVQEIDLGPSSRILIAYRLEHKDKDFSHSMVIWTSVSHCIYAEQCCHVDYSYWVRVKKSGIAIVDSDAEVGRYFPIRDDSQSVPGEEFKVWTNATTAQPEWCTESGRVETIFASFAETGRLEVFLKIQNSPTLSDIRTFRDGHLYTVAAFYYDKRSDEFSSTIIFSFNELRREWTEHQILPSFGMLSLDVTTYRSDKFVDKILLALGTGMGSYPDSYSSVYKWNDTKRAFKLIQNIPSQYVTSTLWVKKDFIQLLLLAGVDELPASNAECLILSGGQIDVYMYDRKLLWIQSIPLGGVASMITFTVKGDVFVAAASSHLQSIVIFQWQGYAGFTQIQTFFVQDIRHMTAYWIESEFYLAVSSASGPAKIFRAVTRGKHLTISDKLNPLVPEQKDQPPLDQKFISGC